MSVLTTLERLGRRVARPRLVMGVAAALLVVSFGLGLYDDQVIRAQSVRQTQVQANILASSLAAPLAFDDRAAAQEYINALAVNPAVEAAGAYDTRGLLVAALRRGGAGLPPSNAVGPPRIDKGTLAVTADAQQGATSLGSVYLRVSLDSFARRLTRYLGIAAVIVMASLLIAALGSATASLAAAHRRLQEEIAEREKAENALRQAQKMEAMGQLTGGVAHDFNNLLMVASSGLDLMDRTADPIRRDRLKQGIRHAIERGANLTQQLLVFARRTPMRAEIVDLGRQLAGMRDLLDRSLREDVAVEIETAPDLWPVEVDPSQFEVAVLNLALNARDAMPSGGRIHIRLANEPGASADTPDRVRVSVVDTGVGMAPEVVTRIFEPFFTTKGVGEGTGLGLSQVYGFARSSGGEAQVESAPGQGTTVSLLLPRSAKGLPERQLAPRRAGRGGARKCRVLLVEDDEHVAELVMQMLTELGYEPTRAPNAVGALEMLRLEHAYDLVFSDMVMPGEIGGLELAQMIAKQDPGLPVILTTGYSASAAAAATEGMRLLVKPYRIEALAAEIEAALRDSRRTATEH